MVDQEYINPKIFKPRLQIPSKTNPYYNRKADGGYSTAIKGNNTEPGLSCLRNCVGFSIGRFFEILGDKSFSLLKPVNAENFIQYADKSLEIGQVPKIGACMVWEGKGNLAGHVASVEVVKSSIEIITAESGWSASKPFWNQTRKKGVDGNWGQNSNYKFLGFIYNPAPCCQDNSSNIISNTVSNTVSNTSTVIGTVINNTLNSVLKATEVAKKKDKNLSGTYIVTAKDGLYIRNGAGTDKTAFTLLPYGTEVKNYGYYNLVGNTKWLYIQVSFNNVTYTGYSSIDYLKKK